MSADVLNIPEKGPGWETGPFLPPGLYADQAPVNF
jgi:hypothetical protein